MKLRVKTKYEWGPTARLEDGEDLTIRYEADGVRFVVESRKRQIPHANGSGSWTYVSYHLINPETGKEKKFQQLSAAVLAAELLEKITRDREDEETPRAAAMTAELLEQARQALEGDDG